MKRTDIPEEEIFAAVDAFHADLTRATPEEALAHKYPPKLILARMKQMVDEGKLDYGVSLRTAFRV